MRQIIFGGLLSITLAVSAAEAAAIKIVAAENFYGDIAQQIGGGEKFYHPRIVVQAVINNDPGA